MTSNRCSKGCRPAAGLFAVSLKRQVAITLLFAAGMLLLCACIILPEIFDTSAHQNIYPLYRYGDFFVASGYCIILSTILGAVLLCCNHSHFFSRRSADMYYSLPLKRDTLLLVRFGASAVGAIFAFTVAFAAVAIVNFLPNVEGVGVAELLGFYILSVAVLLLFLATILIFVVNAGGVFHFIFSLLVVCLAFPLVCNIFNNWYAAVAKGVVTYGEWLHYISPFSFGWLALVSYDECLAENVTVYMAGKEIENRTIYLVLFALFAVAVILLLTLIFGAIAFVMNRRRKTERAGESFAFSSTYSILVFLAACLGGHVIGGSFQSYNAGHGAGYWIAFVFAAALTAVAVGAIAAKGFRRFWRWLICAGGATLVMLIAFTIVHNAGMKDKMFLPRTEEIKSVTISETYGDERFVVTENFEAVLNLHEYMLEEKTETHSPWDYFGLVEEDKPANTMEDRDAFMIQILSPTNVTITYELNDGSIVEREYNIQFLEARVLYMEILRGRDLAGELEAMTEVQDMTVGYSFYLSDIIWSSAKISKEDACLLLETYMEELRQIDLEYHETRDEYIEIHLENYNPSPNQPYDYYKKLIVPTAFTKTRALLKELLEK